MLYSGLLFVPQCMKQNSGTLGKDKEKTMISYDSRFFNRGEEVDLIVI